MMRKPVAAGRFYSGSTRELRQQIEDCFLDQRGPGFLPEVAAGPGDIKGCVVPHAGYPFSGPMAAHVYAAVAQDGLPDTVVIVGPNHTGYGAPVALAAQATWTTPLGDVPVNREVENKLASVAHPDKIAHLYEHSIEVQLPFLQYLSRSFSLVPVCLARQDYETAAELGTALAELEDVLLIASTDFSHVGMGYGEMPPPGTSAKTWAEQQDKKALAALQSMDVRRFVNTVEEHGISMCGYGCVAAVMAAAKKRGAREARLLSYSTSCDVYPADSCVGYGALVFR
ncbi:MAG TPA: AmmeMemoRadiSam system protein B [Thermoplasmatales archaeon]|nr:AmmeMemoRadiSam system protein B [Candidatus Thermoplasmatota archaeon]MDD5778238.1 AmmeMemoRadiSam system protein B [Candidatus Thermoplasmatota archaeon]HDS59773.1 AmmeMemoRadiSam system protein B [Thermoplasmatales archaeon]